MSHARKLTYEGPYKELIIEYLQIKHLRGCKPSSYKYQMSSLNRFLVEEREHETITITEEDIELWVDKATSQKGKMCRFDAIDQFSTFLVAKGYQSIFRGDSRQYSCTRAFQARILDEGELAAFLDASDNIEQSSHYVTYDHATVFPMLVRLLYGCGLRLSEGLNLKTDDINQETGAIQILDSKNGNSRLVYASDSLLECIKRYSATIRANSGDGYLLRGHDGRRYKKDAAENIMRKVRVAAGLDGDGQQKLRLHDLRHNFAIRAMEKMVDEGFDLYSSIPYLREYMGHADIRDTEYYIRLAPRGFRRIVDKVETYTPDVIPALKG